MTGAAMTRIAKRHPGSCPGHIWEHPDAVLEVDHHLAAELLSLQDGGFYEPPLDEVAPADEFDESASSAKPVKRRT
jgi:hypothetical protein